MRAIRSGRLAARAASASAIACGLVAGVVGGLVAGVLATPASAVTNLYAALDGTSPQLTQYAVGPGGALTPLAPAVLAGGARDTAITPDGRFAYVALSFGSDDGLLAQFARGAGGRMEAASVISAGAADPRGILVNPQGTRVIYANAFTRSLRWRPIGSDGLLGAATTVDLAPLGANPRFLAMTQNGTSLYVGDAGLGFRPTQILQFDVDPASGAITAKAPAAVGWPGGGPTEIARMTVSPDGRHLYATSGETGDGIARFDIGASGALTGGSELVAPTDRSATSVIAIAPGGLHAYAPTNVTGLVPPGEIHQFSRDASTGALSPLAPPAADYQVDLPTRDAVASPDGRSLYLGQSLDAAGPVANVGEWTITAGGTVSPRANLAAPAGTERNAGIVLAPSQAPVASFTATPAPAGQPTTFDGSSSSDPDGTVARYDWDFGDGTTLADGGPAPSRVYASAGTPVVRLTVTDADGTSTSALWTGARMLRNGGPSATTTRTLTIAAAVVPPPPPPPPPPARPAPDKGASVTVRETFGRVRVRLPGTTRYVELSRLTEIPLGSRVDARKGRVQVTAEVDAATHRTESSLFYDGIFDIRQTKGSKPILEATIVGGTFAGCQPRRASSAARRGAAGGPLAEPFLALAAATKKRSKRKVRRLWGKGEGSFRTKGKRSSATVRGTWWLVEDRCDGTLNRVKQGRVDVRDFRLKKTIRLRAGQRSIYLAKAPSTQLRRSSRRTACAALRPGEPAIPPVGAVPAPLTYRPATGVRCEASAGVGRSRPSWSSVTSRTIGCAPGQRSSRAMSCGVRTATPWIVSRKPGARASTWSSMLCTTAGAARSHPSRTSNGAAGHAR